jgi:hypothetical protein
MIKSPKHQFMLLPLHYSEQGLHALVDGVREGEQARSKEMSVTHQKYLWVLEQPGQSLSPLLPLSQQGIIKTQGKVSILRGGLDANLTLIASKHSLQLEITMHLYPPRSPQKSPIQPPLANIPHIVS